MDKKSSKEDKELKGQGLCFLSVFPFLAFIFSFDTETFLSRFFSFQKFLASCSFFFFIQHISQSLFFSSSFFPFAFYTPFLSFQFNYFCFPLQLFPLFSAFSHFSNFLSTVIASYRSLVFYLFFLS